MALVVYACTSSFRLPLLVMLAPRSQKSMVNAFIVCVVAKRRNEVRKSLVVNIV